MRWLLAIPVVWLAAVFQTTISPAMTVRQVGPDALAMLAGLLVAEGPLERRSAWLAAILGLASDLISPGPFGVGFLAYFAAAHLILALRARLSFDMLPIRLAWVAGFAATAALLVGLAYVFSGHTALSISALAGRAVGVGLYTAALALPIAMILSWMPHRSLATSH